MLYRKISRLIVDHLRTQDPRILLVDGARQVGKTYIIRYVGQQLFENFIEVNMVEDSLGERLFAQTRSVEDFYLLLSMLHGNKMKEKQNTLVFLDEIQEYPQLLTLLKFLAQDGRFTYIASGSLLGVTLAQTISIPMGSIRKVRMYPLDLEEFLLANGLNEAAIMALRAKFQARQALDEAMHNKMMDLFRKYLLVGGLPDAVNAFLQSRNIQRVREVQREIHDYYAALQHGKQEETGGGPADREQTGQNLWRLPGRVRVSDQCRYRAERAGGVQPAFPVGGNGGQEPAQAVPERCGDSVGLIIRQQHSRYFGGCALVKRWWPANWQPTDTNCFIMTTAPKVRWIT